ncbi:hypothetical protein [Mucilaginibacter phyllosphaerae]|uniref:Uncharacterized protein n=1 Tax=Mucilaginibacter phyllosphaerae TaxID=1812349 RepID=A0A4Y8A9F6_9SPHI|nr:hypothetical protein [Mucilaginibacter phyllosphaerae]MBB3969714.1 hypothetical protein [Mucilaginibacter phyllosphaerae]TEW65097.1 hypothetical protein E2R65_14370 [Mucilaginibacter phyllosphaerae]GGH18001.1 hypothetical protein GCM10007352_28430 [Mucilaginibacter phyllosphaerae]
MDIFLEVVGYENFPNAISNTGLQAEYNKALCACDMAVFLVFSKVGTFTNQEFDAAMAAFKNKQSPQIWTYFKNEALYPESIREEDIRSLFAFKKKLKDLMHYRTAYNNIDHLKYQFKVELDHKYPSLFAPAPEKHAEEEGPKSEIVDTASKRAYNEVLSFRLFEAIRDKNDRAKELFEIAEMNEILWQHDVAYRKEAKAIIASAYGVLGVQLRKLMAIGAQDNAVENSHTANENQKNYIIICHLTALRAIQLLCFAMLSKLWDEKSKGYLYEAAQVDLVRRFFNTPVEMPLAGYKKLLLTLLAMFDEKQLDYPMIELKNFMVNMQPGSAFITACDSLNAMSRSAYSEEDCKEAENSLTVMLEHLSFLTNYTMESIKNVEYFGLRNIKQYYVHNYTALGCDENTTIDLSKQQDAPLNTYAVLLKNTKIAYQPKLNLFPFIIDANALAAEKGAKIYFYSSTSADGSLKYSFWEDRENVIAITQSPAGGAADVGGAKFNASRSLDVLTLFEDAQRAITGTEQQPL